MNKTGIVIILLCFLAAAAVVLWERRKARKTMEEIERMLNAAMTGSFSETNFDESQLSALETKFAHYLSAAEASSRNVAQEKDKIKALIADISHQTKTPIANLLLWERRKARKTMEEIERMLDAAMTGSFSETNFDESQLSALETKFAHYLSAAEASSQNIAQEKDKIKTLIADISHQTKTPIANLLLYSELLMEETLPASAKANVEALYKQSEKLRILIDSLVKLSRLENGIISLSPQPAALQPLLESVVEQYTAKASEKGLSLQMQDTDAFAVFDFKWTAEALANIVDNAIKYTEHGTITISAVSYEMFARIDISDTGSGIPESEQAKIFARFYRSNSVQKQEGVGIGLYLARQIISGEGGYIKVASVPGKGSTFSIFLPK